MRNCCMGVQLSIELPRVSCMLVCVRIDCSCLSDLSLIASVLCSIGRGEMQLQFDQATLGPT